MKPFLLFFIIISSISINSGCAIFTPPKEKPVQQDYIGPVFGTKTINVFSLTPERRIVIVAPPKQEEGNGISLDKNIGIEVFQFCAEPPPDVAESLVDTLRIFAKGEIKNVEAQAELSRLFASSAINLFVRSQGVQLFRDGAFNLCQAYINGVINKKKYWENYQLLLANSTDLISKEIPNIRDIKMVEAAGDAETKELDELKKKTAKIKELLKLMQEGPLVVTNISPSESLVGKVIDQSILTGKGFKEGAAARLVKDKVIIEAEEEKVVDSNTILCSFKIPEDSPTGKWDIFIINPDGQTGTLSNKFEIK
jgi:hypothetical protein